MSDRPRTNCIMLLNFKKRYIVRSALCNTNFLSWFSLLSCMCSSSSYSYQIFGIIQFLCLAEVIVDFSSHLEKCLRQRKEVRVSIAYTSDFATFLILLCCCKFSQILSFFHKSRLYSIINSNSQLISASEGKNHCCAAR